MDTESWERSGISAVSFFKTASSWPNSARSSPASMKASVADPRVTARTDRLPIPADFKLMIANSCISAVFWTCVPQQGSRLVTSAPLTRMTDRVSGYDSPGINVMLSMATAWWMGRIILSTGNPRRIRSRTSDSALTIVSGARSGWNTPKSNLFWLEGWDVESRFQIVDQSLLFQTTFIRDSLKGFFFWGFFEGFFKDSQRSWSAFRTVLRSEFEDL